MPTSTQIEKALKQVQNQESFFKTLLATTLDWPTGDARQIGDIAYGWSQQDLSVAGLERNLVEGSIWQVQPSAADQPWGIFVLEFKHEDSLSPRRGLARVLRTVLKGLVSGRRRDPDLPSWLSPTFRFGPVMVDVKTLKMPVPTELPGSFSWDHRATVATWAEDPVVNPTDEATLPPDPVTGTEGWLRLMPPPQSSGSSGTGGTG
jgi:hypothetical protein